ncbi:Ku protein [Nocardiopsis gilva YIM 90087]|uniref:Non-homologous end joining protein Ku n=1 Tax=Nocardiopsis gilva YIM 90087 TaxID=1235441 RepID=A0A223SDG0_9ACTN|nr:Ku protein [Nocardiopsis gilva]ASU86194.1 Ku protein [Nocardiopsis gilva YIM 90087]
MASTVWKGTLSVGLLALGIRLYSARERHGPTMHQFVRGSTSRVRYRRIDEASGKEVADSDIVKGAQVDGSDEYVVIEPVELERIAPGRTKTMEITRFIPRDAVAPLWYATTYYMGPLDKAAAKPYRLLCAALERTGRLGLATMVMRDREHLVLVGPQAGVLTAATLWWPDEIRAPEDVMPPIPQEPELADRDLTLAEQLVEAMAEDWAPEEYEDTYQARLEELIAAKAKGQTITYGEEPAAPPGTVVELTDALRQTLEARRGKKKRAPKPRAPSGSSPKSGATKKELLEKAQQLGVPGRSKMSKDELVAAIEERSSA